MNTGTTINTLPQTSFLDVLAGREAVKIEIGVSMKSIAILAISFFVVGILLIAIAKKPN